MSKSYSRRERRERRQDAARSRMSVENARQPDQPDVITPEWAVGRMAEHINYELEQLIEGGRIRIEDKPELAAAIKERICKSLPAYDEGKSSAVHFLTVVVDNEMSHIRAALDSMKRNIETKPIRSLRDRTGGAAFLGTHLEGRYLNPAKRGAHDASLIVSPEADELRRFAECSGRWS